MTMIIIFSMSQQILKTLTSLLVVGTTTESSTLVLDYDAMNIAQ